jgi:hypothetical protein
MKAVFARVDIALKNEMFSRQTLARGNLLLILASILPWSAAGNDGGFQFPTQVSSPIGAKLSMSI